MNTAVIIAQLLEALLPTLLNFYKAIREMAGGTTKTVEEIIADANLEWDQIKAKAQAELDK